MRRCARRCGQISFCDKSVRDVRLASIVALSLAAAAPARAQQGYDLCRFLPQGVNRAVTAQSRRTGKFDNCQATFGDLEPWHLSVMIYDHGSAQAASHALNNSVPRVN